jgi:hypothetical protein
MLIKIWLTVCGFDRGYFHVPDGLSEIMCALQSVSGVSNTRPPAPKNAAPKLLGLI